MDLSSYVSNPAESRGPMLESVYWTLMALSTIAISLRIYARYRYSQLRADDWCLIFAYACQVVFTVLEQMVINMGFGKHALDVNLEHLHDLTIYGFVTLSLAIVAVTVAKISFAITLLTLANGLWKWINWTVWFLVIVMVMITIPVAILPWVQCVPLEKSYIDLIPGKCIDKNHTVRLGMFLAGFSSFLDFVLATLPWKILWKLQMRPIEKVGVGLAMSLGWLAGVMGIMRTLEVPKLTVQDASYDGPFFFLWADIELATTIIAACIPALRRLLKDTTLNTMNRAARITGANNSNGSATKGGRSTPGASTLASSRNAVSALDKDGEAYQLAQFDMGNDESKSNTNQSTLDQTSSARHRKKHNSTGNKWYSVYQGDKGQDSDESIMLQDPEVVVTMIADKDGEQRSEKEKRGNADQARWTNTTPPADRHSFTGSGGTMHRPASSESPL